MGGGTLHAGMPLLMAGPLRSSEGLVNELLIWLHSALMLSASAATDGSISGTVKRSMDRVNYTKTSVMQGGTTWTAFMPQCNKCSGACGIGLGRMARCLI